MSGVAPAGTTSSDFAEIIYSKELVKLSVVNSALFIRTLLYVKFGSFYPDGGVRTSLMQVLRQLLKLF